MKRQKKKSMYVALAALVLMISIGYAALSANIRINGTSRIDDVTWDVHFENAQATDNSTVTPTTAPSASAASKLRTISYDVTFDTPGQVYEFTVDVVNGGSIDAMIESFTSKIKIGNGEEATILADKSNLPAYLDYDVTYGDGTAIANNHALAHNTSETIKVRIEFKRDITEEQLAAASGKTITLNVGLNYKQADGTEISTNPFQLTPGIYTVNFNDYVYIGQTISDSIDTFNNASSAVELWNEGNSFEEDYLAHYHLPPICLKHVLDSNDNTVTQSYVEFVVTNNYEEVYDSMTAGTYEIRGGVDETTLSQVNQTVYNRNKAFLNRAFGETFCSEEEDEGIYTYRCSAFDYSIENPPELDVEVKNNGEIWVGLVGDEPKCIVNGVNGSDCYS